MATALLLRHGDAIMATNLTLNSLVYLAQVESLRKIDEPLFEDKVEAWDCGPVEPEVHAVYGKYGHGRIPEPEGAVEPDERTNAIIDTTVRKYGRLTAFDLAELYHREGSAWRSVYRRGEHAEITVQTMLDSNDGLNLPKRTLAKSLDDVGMRWPNTFRILRDA